MNNSDNRLPSSYRDPTGFVFLKKGAIYRQINKVYKINYELLINSGLYKRLVDSRLLITHKEASRKLSSVNTNLYKIIKPEPIAFISYPYEWSFSQLKDAALLTLKIQKIALDYGMCLKDANAYNIQFQNGKPIFIDTLSFEKYIEDQPWIAYKQYCQHFLAPLALMAFNDVRLGKLLQSYLDGIPLDLAWSLLPPKKFLNFSLFLHIYLHAKSQSFFASSKTSGKSRRLSKKGILAIIDSLENIIKNLKLNIDKTQWSNYYIDIHYSTESLNHKKQIVENFIIKTSPKCVWDLGANTGLFSRIASKKGIQVISFDVDALAVEKNYLECINKKETKILPLIIDLTNPSPPQGFALEERLSLIERGPADLVLALALVHHLAISYNIPLSLISNFFRKICKWLIIEFVPKDDEKVKQMLLSREDVFDTYNQQNFEKLFSKNFKIIEKINIKNSKRTIYLMKKHEN